MKLKNLVSIEGQLPPKVTFRKKDDFDKYGMRFIAEEYCNIDLSDVFPNWQHGWVADERNFHPQAVLTSMNDSKESLHLVSRISQEVYLKKHGYAFSKAIGSALIYIPEVYVKREPKSLLVMPVHSLNYTTHNHWKFKEYAEYIKSLMESGSFERVTVCIHPACIRNGYWINEFKELGIEIIEGVETNDKNAFYRLKVLFSLFEYVTTNGKGSHIPYAAYCGAKVSICGPFAEYKVEDFIEDPFYKKFPDILKPVIDYSSYESIKKLYPQFIFDSPEQATENNGWAKEQLGFENKLTPRDFRILLGKNDFSVLKNYLERTFSWLKNGLRVVAANLAPNYVKKMYRSSDRSENPHLHRLC